MAKRRKAAASQTIYAGIPKLRQVTLDKSFDLSVSTLVSLKSEENVSTYSSYLPLYNKSLQNLVLKMICNLSVMSLDWVQLGRACLRGLSAEGSWGQTHLNSMGLDVQDGVSPL